MFNFKKNTLLLLVLSLFHLSSISQNLLIDEITRNKEFNDSINILWNNYKPYITKSIEQCNLNTYNLYKVQITTSNLLRYSFENKNYELVDDLLSTYMLALANLDTLKNYRFSYFSPLEPNPDTVLSLDKNYYFWLSKSNKSNPPKEDILSVSQFLSLISDAFYRIAKVPVEERSETMIQFVESYSDVLDNHYKRWVFGVNVINSKLKIIYKNAGPFQRRGWACKYNNKYVPTHLNHMQLIELLLNYKCGNGDSKKFCNSITDTDLWIIAGLSSFVAAHKIDTTLVKNISNIDFYIEKYLPLANKLIISRISTTSLLNFDSIPVWGANFDNGMFDDYPDNKYSGYNDANIYPKTDNTTPASNIGWDISHARRFVNVFQTLYETKKVLGFNFPNSKLMAMFANQFAYKIFNKDFEFPLFSNYFDGTNGWYRVGYSNRKNFGYGPNDLSISAITSGYFFWQEYNHDLRKIANSLYLLIHSKDSIKQDFLNKHYELTYWNNDSLTNLPIRKQSVNFKNVFTEQQDSASVLAYLSFYSSINFLPDYFIINTEQNDNILIYQEENPKIFFIQSLEKITNIKIFNNNDKIIYAEDFFNSIISINTEGINEDEYIIEITTDKNNIYRRNITIK